ncbi:hypothetical protein WJX73_000189 [Symbiochloris irregularis]|uniref:Uncharacterized protein n=1 Tax=Symbiochloris irregularis TaxID=706552 RepID=A0AAW1P0S5_9CHLO
MHTSQGVKCTTESHEIREWFAACLDLDQSSTCVYVHESAQSRSSGQHAAVRTWSSGRPLLGVNRQEIA